MPDLLKQIYQLESLCLTYTLLHHCGRKKNIDINKEVLETENKSGCQDFQLSQRYLVSNMVCLTNK